MKKMIVLLLIFLPLIGIFIHCEEELALSDDPAYQELKKFIKSKQDHRATFTFGQYEKILNELSQEKYVVLTINEFRNYIDSSKVVVGLRHDVDCHPFKAWEMAQMEKEYGISASYYILATASYYGKIDGNGVVRFSAMRNIYQNIYSTGAEIGIHNDLISVLVKYGLNPLDFNKNELRYYRSMGIDIHGSVAHGSSIARKTKPNFWVFSNFAEKDYIEYKGNRYRVGQYSMKDFGFEYEANFVNHNMYFSDSGGEWNIDGGLEKILNELKNSEKGDRIQILAHPVWWGK